MTLTLCYIGAARPVVTIQPALTVDISALTWAQILAAVCADVNLQASAADL